MEISERMDTLQSSVLLIPVARTLRSPRGVHTKANRTTFECGSSWASLKATSYYFLHIEIWLDAYWSGLDAY